MIGKDIIELLRNSRKSYFSTAELANYLGINKSTLKVILSRLIKQKKLLRIIRGYYCLPQRNPDVEQLAVEFYYPSYISLEYALAIYGIISQVPSRLTLVTSKRGAVYSAMGSIIEFTHIGPALFFGYDIKKQTQIARPEKALLDELYLIGLKKRRLDLGELDQRSLKKSLFEKWLKLYPPSTARLAVKLKLVSP